MKSERTRIYILDKCLPPRKKLGYKPTFYHVSHGLIRWKDGKFSTRHGDTIHLSEVIENAHGRGQKNCS